MPGTFSDKVVNFTDEPVVQSNVPLVENTFDMNHSLPQTVYSRPNINTERAVSGTNYVHSFSFLRNRSI